MLHDTCKYEERIVPMWAIIIFRKKDVCSVLAASLRFIVESCVRVDGKVYTTCTVQEAIVWMGCDVVEQFGDGTVGASGYCCLVRDDCAQPNMQFVVNGRCLLEERSNNALDALMPALPRASNVSSGGTYLPFTP